MASAPSQLKVVWMGPYPFDITSVKANVPPNIPGVYAIWLQSASDSPAWEVAYVGKAGGATDNLRKRLLDHLADTESNPCIKDLGRHGRVAGRSRFSYGELSREADRERAEKYLYDELKPECNHNDPGGVPCPVNRPRP